MFLSKTPLVASYYAKLARIFEYPSKILRMWGSVHSNL